MGGAASRWPEDPDWNHETGLQARHAGAGWPVVSLEVMLALTVTSQVHLALEALGAQLTAEGLEACVLAAVGDEVGALAEGFSTHLALVRLLTCVDVGVFLHVRLLVEAFPTELAGVGPSVRMDEQVGGQGG